MKQRITISLDAELVEALRSMGGANVSAVANQAIRRAVEGELHRSALLRWLDELDAREGAATDTERAEIGAFVDELEAQAGGASPA